MIAPSAISRALSTAVARLRSAAKLALMAGTISGQVLLSGHIHPPALKARTARESIAKLSPQAPDCPLCSLTAQLRSIHAGAARAATAFASITAAPERTADVDDSRSPRAPSARGPPRALPPPRPRSFDATTDRLMNDAGERR